jgi:uncharacterized phage infection (PIP) family protein YhgE
MVAVYLLGHRVGNLTEPVLYINKEIRNRNGEVVTQGLPDPFLSSLTHDSVIVQIPLLRGQVNTRLDRILSIFDQTNKDGNDQHTLRIDETLYTGDSDMHHIIHRLLAAASEPQVRQDMNVEDEYFSIIEKRDTEILMRDRKLAEQKVELDEQKAQLDEQKAQLDEQKAQLDEKKAQLDEKTAQLDEKTAQLDEQKAQLDEKKAQLDEKTAQLDEKTAQLCISIRALNEKGLSAKEIATILNMDIDTVRALLTH